MKNIHAVTGAFGYSGRYIASRLLDEGHEVITLTGSVHRNSELSDRVKAVPLDFERPGDLAEALDGVSTLYNTYWVRFNHRLFKHTDAVANSKTLFEAAKAAGVERVVHVSITNPSIESPLSYFRGKAEVELALENSGLSFAILRPAVLFGKEDILINNIAWALRRLPVFGVFGHGTYRLCPIYVEDLAAAAVEFGKTRECVVVDAVGPETFTFRELVETIGRIIGVNRPVFGVPGWLGWLAGRLIGTMHGDVMITLDEVRGLTAGLLEVDSRPLGATRLTEWARARRATLGLHYTSEMARRRDRRQTYRSNSVRD
ncbi:MAG: SDR family oxidoreductase [Thermoanaerobaculales bacterium]